jgi:hypothetical protein
MREQGEGEDKLKKPLKGNNPKLGRRELILELW